MHPLGFWTYSVCRLLGEEYKHVLYENETDEGVAPVKCGVQKRTYTHFPPLRGGGVLGQLCVGPDKQSRAVGARLESVRGLSSSHEG